MAINDNRLPITFDSEQEREEATGRVPSLFELSSSGGTLHAPRPFVLEPHSLYPLGHLIGGQDATSAKGKQIGTRRKANASLEISNTYPHCR